MHGHLLFLLYYFFDVVNDLDVSIILETLSMLLIEEEEDIDNGDNKHGNPWILINYYVQSTVIFNYHWSHEKRK